MKICTVKKTGKRYIYAGEHRDVVVCRGEIRSLNGFSATHGPDKKFKRDTVWVVEVDLNEGLLAQLLEQSDIKDPPPPPPIPAEPEKPKWVEWFTDFDGKRRALLTEHADERLVEMGRDMAADIEGIDEFAQDAAMDAAAYLPDLTREGVREGYTVPCREAAADMIHEGIIRGLEGK